MPLACKATEQLSFDEALAALPRAEAHARNVLAALGRIRPLPPGSTILDVGAAQGRFLVGCARLGYRAAGVEPWDEARHVARQLGEHLGLAIDIRDGTAERLPALPASFDVVHASSVLEHVHSVQAAMNEAHRVLKSGGVFWFFTASSLCPRQQEIRGFPLFPWYPDRLKRRIMLWAMDRRPHLVGNSRAPALHWFTPGKARRMLRRAGFARIYDRWDLASGHGGLLRRMLLGTIRLTRPGRLLADLFVSGCAYAAVK